jgi:hypothetical protein
VKFDLEKILNAHNLLPKTKNHIIDPLIELLGYSSTEDKSTVTTREGPEDAGYVLKTTDTKTKLRFSIIPIDPGWKQSREVPDTFRFLIALASPKGIELLPEIIDKARLKQSTITKDLRKQARQAQTRNQSLKLSNQHNST